MKFGILTHTTHKVKDENIYAYEPYIREMNLWIKHVDKVKVLAPCTETKLLPIDAAYTKENIVLKKVPAFNIISVKNAVSTIFKIPFIIVSIFNVCFWADHIHIRCPGNIGLLASFVQIFFPRKKKTVKYAGNWDPNSKQPFSYRLQKRILSNTFLTRNCKVLVYGDWKHQTKNIVPFFTASYLNAEIVKTTPKELIPPFQVVYVGTLSENKRPFLTIRSIHQLMMAGHNVELNMYGEGPERDRIEAYITENELHNHIFLHGNQPKDIIKKAYIDAHFIVFISKSEGWPKVVAEAMFWGCLPIVSKVSCVPYMINEDKRGTLVNDTVEDIMKAFNMYINNKTMYNQSISEAKKWSRQFTLDKFEMEISNLLKY